MHLHKNNEYYLFCVTFCFINSFCDQIGRYGPPLSLRCGTRLDNLCFCGAQAFVVLKSTSGAMTSCQQINLSIYPLNAVISKWPASQINCPSLQQVILIRTSIQCVIIMALETAKSFWKLFNKNVWEYIFYDEAIRSKIRNRMWGEIMYDSVREASATGNPLIEICNKWLIAIVSMTHSLVFPF